MAVTAGASFQKPISEWFNPHDHGHLRAFAYFRRRGQFPPGFLTGDVWLDGRWLEALHAKIEEKAGGVDPPEVRAWAAELDRLVTLVRQVTFPGYVCEILPQGDEFALQVSYVEPDVMTGVVEEQRGRKWLIPPGQTNGQVVQTAFKAVLTSLEHRAREHFLYRGKPVLNPHLDIDAVWGSMPTQERVSTEIFNAE